jgi:hypothetical protein
MHFCLAEHYVVHVQGAILGTSNKGAAKMKVQITGYEQDRDVFIYNVLYTVGERSEMNQDRYGCAISGEFLNNLSVSLPHSKPGQMGDEERLLAMIHDEYWIEEPHDLIGHEAARYMVPAKVLYAPSPITQEKINEWVEIDRKELEAFEKAGDAAQGDGKPLRIKLRPQEMPDGYVPLNSENVKRLNLKGDE